VYNYFDYDYAIISGKRRKGCAAVRKKRKSIVPRIIVLVFVVYISATLIKLQIDINAKKQEINSLNAQIQQQKKTNAELQSSLSANVDKDYVSKVAREKLGYGDPNEQFYVDVSGN
jgi:cell division protein FtsB